MVQQQEIVTALQASSKIESIQVYVYLVPVLLAILALFGSFRGRCHNWFFRLYIWSAFVQSTFVVTYTLGLMQSTSISNKLFPIWAIFLIIVYQSADNCSAYNLDDNEHWKRMNWEILYQIFLLLSLIGNYSNHITYEVPFFLLLVTLLLKMNEKARACMLASKSSITRRTKLIADFMGYEHELSNEEDEDAIHMKGYKYLVIGEDVKMLKVTPPLTEERLELTDKVITTEKIWQCNGKLLSSEGDPDNRLKDICLSFALFKLLCRRFGGHSFKERSEKTWRFFRNGLLQGDQERVFRVTEVDSLFFLISSTPSTQLSSYREGRGFPRSKIVEFFFFIIGCVTVLSKLPRAPPSKGHLHMFHGRVVQNITAVDVEVTDTVILTILLVEVVQFIIRIFSDWSKVIIICKYFKNESWHNYTCLEKMIKFMCRGTWLKPWERKLGQYSLLRSFNHNPCKLMYNSVTSGYIDIRRKGQKESCRIKLTSQLKKAVIVSLRTNGRILSNGEASLRRNGVENDLSWACRLETDTHVIMVWHIATSLCKIKLSDSDLYRQLDKHPTLKEHHTVATSLSKNCAYLVAFCPRLLPVHAYDAEVIFDQIVNEARDILEGFKSKKKRYDQMMKFGEEAAKDTVSVMKRGAVLGKYLKEVGEREPERMWKILADLWAELILYVAPSDDTAAHAEYLAKGGEFITHLWALLSHSGILKRDSTREPV